MQDDGSGGWGFESLAARTTQFCAGSAVAKAAATSVRERKPRLRNALSSWCADITCVVVLEVAGGRVTAERHYWPLVDGLVQFGLIGPPGHAVGQHPAQEAVH